MNEEVREACEERWGREALGPSYSVWARRSCDLTDVDRFIA